MKINKFKKYFCIFAVFVICIHIPQIVCGYDFKDGLESISQNQQGTKDGLVFLKNIRKVLATHQAEPEVEEFLAFWYESVQKFNFYQLYNSPYLKPVNNGFRAVTFQGYHKEKNYQLALASATDIKIPVKNFGDFKASFGLKQNDTCVTGDRSYSGYIDSHIALKQFSHKTLAALLQGLITVIDPENLNSLKNEESKCFTNLTEFSRKGINAFNKTYPHFLRFVEKYLILHSTMDEKEYNKIPYTHFKLICELNLNNMKKDFPDLNYQLNRLKSLFQLNLSFQNTNGNHILDILLDSQDTFLYINFYTHKGKIIPFNPEGTPVFEDSFHPTKVNDYEFFLDMNIFFNIHGIKFRTDHVKVKCIYKNRNQFGKLKFTLSEIPKTQVSGRAYYIVPPWFIDIMIPGNIDQLIENFSKVLLTANNSDGSYLLLHWDTKKPKDIKFYPYASGEFIDNFFILFGFQIWHAKFKMSDAAATDLNKLIINGTESLILDLNDLK